MFALLAQRLRQRLSTGELAIFNCTEVVHTVCMYSALRCVTAVLMTDGPRTRAHTATRGEVPDSSPCAGLRPRLQEGATSHARRWSTDGRDRARRRGSKNRWQNPIDALTGYLTRRAEPGAPF